MDQANYGSIFSATATLDGDQVTVVVSGEVDMSTADAMVAAATGGPATSAIIDLREVTFFDSAAVHALVRLDDQFPAGMRVWPSPRVRRILNISGLANRWADGD